MVTSADPESASAPNASEESDISKEKLYHSAFVSGSVKQWWLYDVIGPFERYLIAKQVNPNTLTWVGVGINTLAAVFFATGNVLLAGLTIITGGNFDFLDGRVARALNRVTKSGGFLDSVTDRYVDMLLFAGLMIFFRESWMLGAVIAALIGSVMVSYTRAKAESLALECKEGVMQRTERLTWLGAGSIMSGLVTISLMPFWAPTYDPPQFILGVVVMAIAVMSNVVAFQRIRMTYNELKRRQG